MKKITNEQIMKKLEDTKKDISNIKNIISNREKIEQINIKELIEKITTTTLIVNNIQKTIADKETMRMLSKENKKSIIMSYAGLSIAYLGIGFTALLYSMKYIAIVYGIIFAIFFGGSITFAYLGYLKKNELKTRI